MGGNAVVRKRSRTSHMYPERWSGDEDMVDVLQWIVVGREFRKQMYAEVGNLICQVAGSGGGLINIKTSVSRKRQGEVSFHSPSSPPGDKHSRRRAFRIELVSGDFPRLPFSVAGRSNSRPHEIILCNSAATRTPARAGGCSAVENQ